MSAKLPKPEQNPSDHIQGFMGISRWYTPHVKNTSYQEIHYGVMDTISHDNHVTPPTHYRKSKIHVGIIIKGLPVATLIFAAHLLCVANDVDIVVDMTTEKRDQVTELLVREDS